MYVAVACGPKQLEVLPVCPRQVLQELLALPLQSAKG